MKIKELREKSNSELTKLLLEKQNALRELRFLLVSGKVKNNKAFPQARQAIARILTVRGERRSE